MNDTEARARIKELQSKLDEALNKEEMLRRNYEHELNRHKVCDFVNYSTFSVATLLDGTEQTHKLFRLMAEACKREHPKPAEHGNYSEANLALADEIKDWVENNTPEINEPYDLGLYGQLLSGAIDEVDWREVAETFLED